MHGGAGHLGLMQWTSIMRHTCVGWGQWGGEVSQPNNNTWGQVVVHWMGWMGRHGCGCMLPIWSLSQETGGRRPGFILYSTQYLGGGR